MRGSAQRTLRQGSAALKCKPAQAAEALDHPLLQEKEGRDVAPLVVILLVLPALDASCYIDAAEAACSVNISPLLTKSLKFRPTVVSASWKNRNSTGLNDEETKSLLSVQESPI